MVRVSSQASGSSARVLGQRALTLRVAGDGLYLQAAIEGLMTDAAPVWDPAR